MAVHQVHLIDRLDGYGAAEPLRALASAQAAEGKKTTILALQADRGVASRLRSRGVGVRVADQRWPVDPLALLRVALWLREPRDRLHVWGPRAVVLGARLCRRTTGPRVAVLHGRLPTGERAWQRLARACACFDRTETLDRSIYEALTSRAPTLYAASAASVHLVGRSISRWSSPFASRSAALAAWNLKPDSRVIMTTGPLVRRRRLDDAIWNFELVRVLHERAVLVVVGDGPDRKRLERFALLVSDPESVVFVGYRQDWRDLLPFADAYWEVGPCAAPIPQSVCEALIAGAPVVATADLGDAANDPIAPAVPIQDSPAKPLPSGTQDDQGRARHPLWSAASGRLEFARQTDRLLSRPPAQGTTPGMNDGELESLTGRVVLGHG